MQNEIGPTPSGKKVIKTSTGLIVIFSAVVLFFGGALSYWNFYQPDYSDGSVSAGVIARKTNSNINSSNSNTNANGNANVNVNVNVNANTNSSSATADWKTYTNKTYSVSFKYPKDWTANEIVDSTTEQLSVSLILTADKDKKDTDNPGMASVYIYSSVTKLDNQNHSPTDLKDYLDKYAKLADPIYTGVTSQTIGGLSGYVAKMGPNQFGGGSSYFVTLSSGKILQFRTFETGTTADQITNILSTFQFTK